MFILKFAGLVLGGHQADVIIRYNLSVFFYLFIWISLVGFIRLHLIFVLVWNSTKAGLTNCCSYLQRRIHCEFWCSET